MKTIADIDFDDVIKKCAVLAYGKATYSRPRYNFLDVQDYIAPDGGKINYDEHLLCHQIADVLEDLGYQNVYSNIEDDSFPEGNFP